jgi:hypothetical protein
MWCWRRMEKFSWTNHVRNEEIFHTDREKRKEGQIKKIEMKGRRERRCKQLHDGI